MDFIEIQGFKSIKSAKIELKPINILIGGNGSGKSNFLLFFEFLSEMYSQNLQNYVVKKGGENKFLFQGKKVTDKISFHLSFENGNNTYKVVISSGDYGLIIENEIGTYIKNPFDTIFVTNAYETKIKTAIEFRAKYIRNYLNGLKKYHFHDTGSNSPFNGTSNIQTDIYSLKSNGGNLAAFLYGILDKNPKTYSQILFTIKSIAPYFLDFEFRIDDNGNIRLLWKDIYCDNIYGVNDLSDGTIRFIALCVLFLQPNLPKTIIIDEPEIGLHPVAIWKLSGLIQSAASRGCQVILATQSSDLIRYFEPEDIITVDNVDGETIFNRLKTENLEVWLEDYKLDELWKNSTIQTGQPNYKPEVLSNGF